MMLNIQTLRWIGIAEGISFLLLLFVAMPLKYYLDLPIFVKYIGMGHGVLFVLFLMILLLVCHKMKWSLSIFILGILAAALPFGTFIFDHKLKKLKDTTA